MRLISTQASREGVTLWVETSEQTSAPKALKLTPSEAASLVRDLGSALVNHLERLADEGDR